MAIDLNHVDLVGRLTRDPELTYTPSGTAVCKFGLAVNDSYGRDEGRKDIVYFFDVIAWGRQAETCSQYITKGQQVAVSGKLQQDRWENKEGQKRNKVKISAQSVQFLAKPRGQQQDDGGYQSPAEGQPSPSAGTGQLSPGQPPPPAGGTGHPPPGSGGTGPPPSEDDQDIPF